jgi:uncharacterized damage-inducible protein DinB
MTLLDSQTCLSPDKNYNTLKNTNMKAIKFFAALCFALNIVGFAKAQDPVNEMVKEWERAKVYTKEYLDTMPEQGYSLKPTPEMRSFAEQMLHITDANYAFTSAITGEKSPVGFGESEKATDKSKANVTNLVMAGYDFVINSIKKMKPAQLNETVKIFGRFDMTKGVAIAKCFEHQTHHRGQTTVYIRLAGAKPPQEKLF